MSRSRDESIFNFLETTCLNLWLSWETNLNQELKWRRSRTNIWWNRTKKSVISILKSHLSEVPMNNEISLFKQIRSQCWWHHKVGDFKILKRFRQRRIIWPKWPKPSPTSHSHHQHISSPTSITNIEPFCDRLSYENIY